MGLGVKLEAGSTHPKGHRRSGRAGWSGNSDSRSLGGSATGRGSSAACGARSVPLPCPNFSDRSQITDLPTSGRSLGMTPKIVEDPLPDDSMCTHYKLWFGVPLVICYVESCLEPDPLLALGQKSVVARRPFTTLHH